MPRWPRPIDWPSRKKLRKMWKSGMSTSEIASVVCTNRSYVHAKLKRLGIIRPEDTVKRGQHSEKTLKKMRRKARGPKPYLVGLKKNNTSWLGPNNPAWKGGVTAKAGRNRPQGRAYRDFIESIKKRDSHKCVRCGTKKEKLYTHHIKPWKEYPKLRFEPENLVTICFSCHMWVHSKRNTKREYLHYSDFRKTEEFIEKVSVAEIWKV